MRWSREGLAWLAGLVEGEGSFSIDGTGRYIRVKVKMTDEDVVRKAHQVAGLGVFRGPYDCGPGRKDQWVWEVTDSREAYALMIALYHWLGQRRQARIRELVPRWLAYRATNPRRGRVPGTPWSAERRQASLRWCSICEITTSSIGAHNRHRHPDREAA